MLSCCLAWKHRQALQPRTTVTTFIRSNPYAKYSLRYQSKYHRLQCCMEKINWKINVESFDILCLSAKSRLIWGRTTESPRHAKCWIWEQRIEVLEGGGSQAQAMGQTQRNKKATRRAPPSVSLNMFLLPDRKLFVFEHLHAPKGWHVVGSQVCSRSIFWVAPLALEGFLVSGTNNN